MNRRTLRDRAVTQDGVYAANTGELLEGRDGIREGVSGWFEGHPRILASLGLTEATGLDLAAEQLRFRTVGDAAYTLSRFTIHVEPSRCLLDSGYALAVWRQEADGEWRIESLAVNQLREPPEGACAPR